MRDGELQGKEQRPREIETWQGQPWQFGQSAKKRVARTAESLKKKKQPRSKLGPNRPWELASELPRAAAGRVAAGGRDVARARRRQAEGARAATAAVRGSHGGRAGRRLEEEKEGKEKKRKENKIK